MGKDSLIGKGYAYKKTIQNKKDLTDTDKSKLILNGQSRSQKEVQGLPFRIRERLACKRIQTPRRWL